MVINHFLFKLKQLFFTNLLCLAVLYPTFLKAKTSETINLDNTIAEQQEINFSADKTEYIYETGVIAAHGRVVISQEGTLIKADNLYYDKETKTLFLQGNVYILDEKTNQEVLLDEAYLIGSASHIIGANIGTILLSEAVVVGEHFERKNDEIKINRLSFTSCPVENNIAPLWELRAEEMQYDQDQNKITVYGGVIAMKGMPVAWVPYLSYSGQQSQRKSGFLIPEVGSANGSSYVQNNFFLNLSDTQNIYIKHQIYSSINYDDFDNLVDTSNLTNLIQYDHYGYIKDGDFKIIAGFIDERLGENKSYFVGNIKHPINNLLKAEANLSYLSENKFAREYDLTDVIATEEKFSNSYLKVEALTDKMYVSLNGSSSYNVKTDETTNDPSLQSLYFIDLKNYGNISGRSDVYYIDKKDYNTEQGIVGNRLDYTKSVITRAGIFNASLGVRSANSAIKVEGEKSTQDYYVGSTSSLSWEMPFSKPYKDGFVSVGPVLGVFSSDFIANSGSNWSTELKSKTLDSLFSNRYFYTWDSFSEQKAVSYGVNGKVTNSQYNGSFFTGFSQSLSGNNQIYDYALSSLSFNAYDHLQLYYQSSYEIQTNKFTENYLSTKVYNNVVSLELIYILGLEDVDVTRNDEIFSAINLKATENINLYTSALVGIDYLSDNQYDKTFLKEIEFGVLWKHDCLTIGTIVGFKNYDIGQEELDLSASIFIEFKGIGQLKSDGESFESKIFRD